MSGTGGRQLSRKRQQIEGFDFHHLRKVRERKIETQRGMERGREMGDSQTKREKKRKRAGRGRRGGRENENKKDI